MTERRTRKPNRLNGYDYSQNAAYFVTFCIKDRHELLGKVVVGATVPGRPQNLQIPGRPHVELSELGQCVDSTIRRANHDGVTIDKFIIMPNHVHMITVLSLTPGDRGRSPLQYVVRKIKSYVTKQIGFSPWQKSFHDHIIRNQQDYNHIWQYVDENPAKWEQDCFHPNNTKIPQTQPIADGKM